MKIIGHKEVKYKPFYFIKGIDDIEVIPSNSTVIFEYSKDKIDICEHCLDNSINFALICDELKDVLFASSNGASCIVCDKANVKEAQKYADEYLFDAKILLYTTKEEDILWCANLGIDGVLFEDGIIYGDSY